MASPLLAHTQTILCACGIREHQVRLLGIAIVMPAPCVTSLGAAAGTSVVKLALRGHTAWVSSVAWQPGSSSVLVSSSYDGSLHVWDIRSSTPLHKLAAHGDKALSVAWQPTAPPASGEATALPQRFISGGADNLVRFFRLPRTE